MVPPDPEQQTRTVRYPASLEILRFHYPGKPVIPGAVIVGDWLASLPAAKGVCLESVEFRKLVRPEVDYQLRQTVSGDRARWELGRDGVVHASASAEPARAPAARISLAAARPREIPEGFRSPELCFFQRYEEADSTLAAQLDEGATASHLSYLGQLSRPDLLVLIEAAGNLALLFLLQHDVALEAVNDHIFCRFNAISVHGDLARRPLAVVVKARRAAGFLLWDAEARDAQDRLVLSITRGGSVRWSGRA